MISSPQRHSNRVHPYSSEYTDSRSVSPSSYLSHYLGSPTASPYTRQLTPSTPITPPAKSRLGTPTPSATYSSALLPFIPICQADIFQSHTSSPPLRDSPVRANRGTRRWKGKALCMFDPGNQNLYPLFEDSDEEVLLISPMRQPVTPRKSASPRRHTPSPARTLSARASSEILPFTFLQSDDSQDMDPAHTFAVSSDEDSPIVTPRCELADPFAFDNMWDEITLGSEYHPPARAHRRRPPPLDLSYKRKTRPTSQPRVHPYALPGDLSPTRSPRTPLLSPLPIASPGVVSARRRSTPRPRSVSEKTHTKPEWELRKVPSGDSPINLEFELEALLETAGEVIPSFDWVEEQYDSAASSRSASAMSSASDSSLCYRQTLPPLILTTSFPLPPARPARVDDMGLGSASSASSVYSPILSPNLVTPVTPLPRLSSPPRIESCDQSKPSKRRSSKISALQGDHGFLQALSRGESPEPTFYPMSPASSIGSSSSSSSRRSLPRRSGLPDMWRNLGGRI